MTSLHLPMSKTVRYRPRVKQSLLCFLMLELYLEIE